MTTRETLDLLREYESQNITFMEPDGSWPIVWEKAADVHVWDAEGRKYLDLTAAFGVATAGHANPRVVRAGRRQMGRLPHAMGDVHPHALKARLARELSRLTFERWEAELPNRYPAGAKSGSAKTIFCNSGFEAVEVALKTALRVTGKPHVIAFAGGYHGLGYGTLNVTHRDHFRAPFKTQLAEFGRFVSYPGCSSGSRPGGVPESGGLAEVEQSITELCHRDRVGAILVEPVQVRGGIHTPDIEFLNLLRFLADRHDALLILDEIYTGFGRTGRWFACEHSAVVPDLICLGKALTGGFPLSACVGRADIMDAAWPRSTGEAIHTSTFLGHPVGCAMALAQIEEIKAKKLVQRSAELGRWLLQELVQIGDYVEGVSVRARGLGLLAGIELHENDGSPATERTLRIIKQMLQRGFILLPEGEHANVLSLTPPLTIRRAQMQAALRELGRVMELKRGPKKGKASAARRPSETSEQ